ncbi:MAG: hypothetical protein IRY99_06365, partial [Isosphaeraceae bacterium]|nr:hypothetical protein [Isosphaeraceae bacterium]
ENASVTVNYLNERSLQAGAAAYAARPHNLTAPMVQVRDNNALAEFQKYDVATRRAMEERVARYPETPAPAPPSRDAPAVPLAVSLGNFFNRYGELVWPAEAPTHGDFKAKRDLSDRASVSVLKEYNERGLAQLTTVADARRKLLDYGRPALEYIRKSSTPAIADMFHVFLLSLYFNLERAASVPKSPDPKP